MNHIKTVLAPVLAAAAVVWLAVGCSGSTSGGSPGDFHARAQALVNKFTTDGYQAQVIAAQAGFPAGDLTVNSVDPSPWPFSCILIGQDGQHAIPGDVTVDGWACSPTASPLAGDTPLELIPELDAFVQATGGTLVGG